MNLFERELSLTLFDKKFYVKQGLHLKMKYFFKYAKNTGLSAKKTCIIKRWKKYIFSLYFIDSTYEKRWQ
jgi:hypothetical protein